MWPLANLATVWRTTGVFVGMFGDSVLYFIPPAIQSLGETQIDLGAAIVPPPTSLLEHSRDSDSRSPLVGQEGDINNAVIDELVEEDSSAGEDDEGI